MGERTFDPRQLGVKAYLCRHLLEGRWNPPSARLAR
jgi:hypothetical protein